MLSILCFSDLSARQALQGGRRSFRCANAEYIVSCLVCSCYALACPGKAPGRCVACIWYVLGMDFVGVSYDGHVFGICVGMCCYAPVACVCVWYGCCMVCVLVRSLFVLVCVGYASGRCVGICLVCGMFLVSFWYVFGMFSVCGLYVLVCC